MMRSLRKNAHQPWGLGSLSPGPHGRTEATCISLIECPRQVKEGIDKQTNKHYLCAMFQLRTSKHEVHPWEAHRQTDRLNEIGNKDY